MWLLELEMTVEQLNINLLYLYLAMIAAYISYHSSTAATLAAGFMLLVATSNCTAS